LPDSALRIVVVELQGILGGGMAAPDANIADAGQGCASSAAKAGPASLLHDLKSSPPHADVGMLT